MSDQNAIEMLRHEVHAIAPEEDYGFVVEEVGDASLVLLGESTHGSQEFYHARMKISQRLIQEKGFDAIAVEADWPDALGVSRFVQAVAPAAHLQPKHALDGFQRFPLWMWRNTEIVKLVMWLQQHNVDVNDPAQKIGFFGLDLYSLHTSMQAVVHYLEKIDPQAAQQARARYGCFDLVAQDPQQYGYAATFGMSKDCEEEVVRQLTALTSDAARYLMQNGPAAADELFYAQQNARVAQHAEAYYRSMFRGRDESWNLRDTHMADTLEALREHLSKQKGHSAKIIVWAHNSHIGDARATEMGDHGQLNLGQLVRQRYPGTASFLLGFTTHTGSVTAASEWDSPAERKAVNPSRPDSYEQLFHSTQRGDFFVPLRRNKYLRELLQPRRLERAIGVIYLPHSERSSHYFHANLAEQFDGLIHFDTTHALHPLDRSAHWTLDDAPETYPSGM
jgi:erythromycin esterase-like protein